MLAFNIQPLPKMEYGFTKNSCQVFKKLRYFVLSAIESIGSIKKNVEDGRKDNNQVIRKLSIDNS